MKGWKTAILLADGRVVSDYDRTTEWRKGVENVVPAPTQACVGLNDSQAVHEALSFVDESSLRDGERLVLLRTQGAGVVVRSKAKRTHERLTAKACWLVDTKATATAWAQCNKAVAPARAQYDKAVAPAWAQHDKATATAWAQCDKAVSTARAQYDKATATARAQCDKAIRLATCRKGNEVW
jgi:hypothetical protein